MQCILKARSHSSHHNCIATVTMWFRLEGAIEKMEVKLDRAGERVENAITPLEQGLGEMSNSVETAIDKVRWWAVRVMLVHHQAKTIG